ncbi:hypothetical protein J7E38_03095 [Bacillus sp. ISL-35]|uniref:hypothetical protein n=1 Tax=Bacillus sp. ISL-35 TaxID=2819122 RepID=UPI001BEAC785|nr:hypothetical protein [Bacillus sp. ISL-35]MBT2677969.1 hypothetical protein [Bacillus sp. ISL-35]MBT2705448.1 hypothetical protein [Chryseobacterium sp. ISL-80]
MEPKQPGSNSLPDFKEMTDRVLANPGTGPQLVIKTNLDPHEVTEENPYVQSGQPTDPEEFKNYFKE